MISVVQDSPQTIWVPVDGTAVLNMGDIVTTDAGGDMEGVIVREQADGIANRTNTDIPFGVVVGFNSKVPTHDATYGHQNITAAADTDAFGGSALEYVLHTSGPYSPGDQRAMVKVALITPATILRADIRNNTPNTAITLLTATAAGTAGETVTTNACDFTPVAGLCSIYCRTGGNAGIYRVTTDTSTTIVTWNIDMPAATAVGDTFVRVPYRMFGGCFARFGDDTYCNYANASETPGTNYDDIIVNRLDLKDAGHEFMDFSFGTLAFAVTLLTTLIES